MKMKVIFFIFVCAVNFCFASGGSCDPVCSSKPYDELADSKFNGGVYDCYRYLSIGVGPFVVVPNVGVGYRERYSQYGWDTALSFSTVGYVHQLSAHLVAHYYLSPLRKNSAYLGFGLIGSGVLTNYRDCGGTLSTDFIFGKELKRSGDSSHFMEMHVGIPSLLIESKRTHCTYLPLMYIKYGIAF